MGSEINGEINGEIAQQMFDVYGRSGDIFAAILGENYLPQDAIDCYEVATGDYLLGDSQMKLFNKVMDYRNLTIKRLKPFFGKKESAVICVSCCIKPFRLGLRSSGKCSIPLVEKRST